MARTLARKILLNIQKPLDESQSRISLEFALAAANAPLAFDAANITDSLLAYEECSPRTDAHVEIQLDRSARDSRRHCEDLLQFASQKTSLAGIQAVS